jgi:biotin transport system substrate-specific component
MVRVSLFASLTVVGGYVAIPLPWGLVPLSLQSFFTYLAGIFLGPWLGAASQIIYILLGGLNLPVFAGGGAGWAILLGPTGGYLWGFVCASLVIGLLSLAIGTAVIYGLGLWQFVAVTGTTWTRALWVGAIVFLPGDIIKMILAATLARKIPSFIH